MSDAALAPASSTATRATVYLDDIRPLSVRVGWGRLGTRGDLGYEGKSVYTDGVRYEHALSTHPPARVVYYLGGSYSRFRCGVALNGDVRGSESYADFAVIADGREIAHARNVRPHEAAGSIDVDISGTQLLELLVDSAQPQFSHAVWLDPRLDGPHLGDGRNGRRPHEAARMLVDCLGSSDIELIPELRPASRCVATVASPGFEEILDDMLGSLLANGGCPDAVIVVFLIGTSPECEEVIAKYRAIPVRCSPRRRVTSGCKAVLYSVARVVRADHYLCIDADTLVVGDLGPLFAASEALPSGRILACRDGNATVFRDVSHVLADLYGGRDGDLERILGVTRAEGAYPLVVNDGVFLGSRSALLALDGCIRGMPGAAAWLDSRPELTWLRNQFIFNLALARLDCGVELDQTNNLQLHATDVEIAAAEGRPDVRWEGRPVRILHMNAGGRSKLRTLRGLYSSVRDPLVGAGDGDSYGQFLTALRGWLGRTGLPGLEQSFYGTNDPVRVRVRDPSMLPVLALLHYLVRANGCVRVLETGTMHGVSAACLASAVAHRSGGRVVSFDLAADQWREELWASLPRHMASVIEAREGDSITGLQAALQNGERYDAALLDSLHTEPHLWAEFELATRLVCPGGLILLHDWRLEEAVRRVLARITAAGYGVVRLLGPCGVEEENGLGLALVENARSAELP